jgi:hypothetical protein
LSKGRSWFDKLTTNGNNRLPFVLSLSKDLISAFLTEDFNDQIPV